MQIIISNLDSKYRRVTKNGRDYIVAPMTLIVPGVLNGNRGAIYYPSEALSESPESWDNTPLLVNHPKSDGAPLKGKDVLKTQGIGYISNTRYHNGRLRAEGWFDVKLTQRIDNRVYQALERHEKIELSTGLSAKTEYIGGEYKGRAYDRIANKLKPDHVAILPDQPGACSVNDGCGVYNAGANCGIGANGFKGGNTCAKGGGRKSKVGKKVTIVSAAIGLAKKGMKLGKASTKLEGGKFVTKYEVTDKKGNKSRKAPDEIEGLIGNQASHYDISAQISKTLEDKYGYSAMLIECFDSSCVYRMGKNLYQVGYTVDKKTDLVTLSNELPVRVSKVSTYKPVENADNSHMENSCQCDKCKAKRKGKRPPVEETRNTERGDTMPLRKSQRAALIEDLVENCSLNEDEAAALEEFSDEALQNMGKTHMKKGKKKAKPAVEEEEEEMENCEGETKPPVENSITDDKAAEHLFGKGITANDVRSAFKTARDIENKNRTGVIDRLTGHLEGDIKKAAIENYSKMPTEQLEFLQNSLPIPEKKPAAPMYFGGSGAPIENGKLNYDPKDILPVSQMEYDSPFAKQA